MKLFLAYISKVEGNGSKIWISPWDRDAKFLARFVSPTPTCIESGRGLRSLPRQKSIDKGADTVLAAEVDQNYFILGYFNHFMHSDMENQSLVREKEFELDENGNLFKFAENGQIFTRSSNILRTHMGNWANIYLEGLHGPSNREEWYKLQFSNSERRFWSGKEKINRISDKNRSKLTWETRYLDFFGQKFEPEAISDVGFALREKNDLIDDTPPPGNVGGSGNYANKGDLDYVNKVITRKGGIPNQSHVFQRETRSSLTEDKEKNLFTQIKEGIHKNGVIRSKLVENSVEGLVFDQKIGFNIDDSGRNWSRDLSLEENFTYSERIGPGESNLWSKELVQEEVGTFSAKKSDEGLKIRLFDTDEENSAEILAKHDGNIEISAKKSENPSKVAISPDGDIIISAGADSKVKIQNSDGDADTELVRYTEIMDYLDKIVDFIMGHDHQTGTGPSTPASAGAQTQTKKTELIDTFDLESIKSKSGELS